MTLRLISASRLDTTTFATQSLLGQSLQHPAHTNLPRTIYTKNRKGYLSFINRFRPAAKTYCCSATTISPSHLSP